MSEIKTEHKTEHKTNYKPGDLEDLVEKIKDMKNTVVRAQDYVLGAGCRAEGHRGVFTGQARC